MSGLIVTSVAIYLCNLVALIVTIITALCRFSLWGSILSEKTFVITLFLFIYHLYSIKRTYTSKLTTDYPVDVLLSQPFFTIQDRKMKQPLVQVRCENGLYILRNNIYALVNTSNRASYELWHRWLGNIHFEVIFLFNKLGYLSLTSVLPKSILCETCQLLKCHKLSFHNNTKCSNHLLDLVHCDLWESSPVISVDGYWYYVVFVDDYSRFIWLYHLKTKSAFYLVLMNSIKFVKTHSSWKIKVFNWKMGQHSFKVFENQVGLWLSSYDFY